MYYPDYHIHSHFSDDSETPVRDILARAIALGMPMVCITDHHDTNCPDGGFHLDPVAYHEELDALREEYADRIELLCGVEIGIDKDLAKDHVVETFLEQGNFDYITASLHYMEGKDPYYRDEFDCSDEELYRRYFENLLAALQRTTGFHTVSHLDYIIRYGRENVSPYSFARYREYLEAILDLVLERDLILEINTYSKKLDSGLMHPSVEILRRYRERGGDRVILGSDAHRAEYVGGGFPKAAAMLQELGFTHLTLITKEGERALPLDPVS